MRSRILALAALLCGAAPLSAQTLDEALETYYAQRYDESIYLFSALLDQDPQSAELHAWAAENHLRLENTDAALDFARAALLREPCNAAAHRVIANTHVFEFYRDPGLDSLDAHARAAVKCAPDDGNGWLTYWMMGVMRRDSAAQALA